LSKLSRRLRQKITARSWGRRERGLLSKVAQVEGALSEKEKQLKAREIELEFLRLQFEQANKRKSSEDDDAVPTLESCGYDESEYQKRTLAWQEKRLGRTVREQLGQQRQSETVERQRENRNRALLAHYERADKLGLADYDEVEAKAAAILGKEIAEELAASDDGASAVLYFLGKNPDKAQDIRDTFDENPALGTLQLGKLMATLQVRPKPKTTDTDIDSAAGGGASKARDWNKELNRMRDLVASGTKSMADLIKFKQDALSAGVTL
jgi:hypothetical protein